MPKMPVGPSGLPLVIDPDDPARWRRRGEMESLVVFLTPEEVSAVQRCAARRGLSVGEAALRALSYGLTVLHVSAEQEGPESLPR